MFSRNRFLRTPSANHERTAVASRASAMLTGPNSMPLANGSAIARPGQTSHGKRSSIRAALAARAAAPAHRSGRSASNQAEASSKTISEALRARLAAEYGGTSGKPNLPWFGGSSAATFRPHSCGLPYWLPCESCYRTGNDLGNHLPVQKEFPDTVRPGTEAEREGFEPSRA